MPESRRVAALDEIRLEMAEMLGGGSVGRLRLERRLRPLRVVF